MFHKAINREFKEGTSLELIFQNDEVKAYNMSGLNVANGWSAEKLISDN